MILTILLLFFIIIIFFIILIFFKFKKTTNNNYSNNDDIKTIELLEFQQNIKSLIEDFKNFSEEIIKKIDNKNNELKKIITEADIKINELKYYIERINLLKKTIDIDKKVVDSEPKEIIKKKSDDNPITLPKFSIEKKAKVVDEENDKYEYIKNLLINGMSVSEIAKITGFSKGEIELIKNLFKEKNF